jgi:AcrR family transcriptional regulator
MEARAAAAQATRDRIVEAAAAAFVASWYDEVTLRAIASDAGVALQTVLNHFGTKEQLFADALVRVGDRIEATRFSVEPGDVDGAIAVLVDDYERTGDANLRFLAVEPRLPVTREPMERGRRGHHDWVGHVFGAALAGLDGEVRARRHAQLVVATDVYTWKLLRRDKGFDKDQTIIAMRELVLALHDTEGGSA